jgi:hypothetical protein
LPLLPAGALTLPEPYLEFERFSLLTCGYDGRLWAQALPVLSLPLSLSTDHENTHGLWANGQAGYSLFNSDYNYWTPNNENAANPATASLPVEDTGSLTKLSQIFPAAGLRNGTIGQQGSVAFYWFNTPSDSNRGYSLAINASYLYCVDSPKPFAYGYSIRCVRI